MGDSILLQPLITVRGSAGTTVVQPVGDAADVTLYKDVLMFIDIRDFSNASMTLQTAPTLDASLFVDMTDTLTPTEAGINVGNYAEVLVPIAKYMRWRITGASAWSLTFSIWLAVNLGGNHRRRLPDVKRSLDEHLKRYDDQAKRALRPPQATDRIPELSLAGPTAMVPPTMRRNGR